jgi:hypothetical protein
MTSVKKIVCVIAAMGLAPSAFAADDGGSSAGGMYVGGSFHAVMLSDLDDKKTGVFTSDKNTSNVEDKLTFSSGYSFGAVVGTHLSGFRVEGEFNWFGNDADKFTTTATSFRANATEANNKDIDGMTGMLFFANAHYDLAGITDVVVPHVGFGLGLGSVTLNANNKTFDTTNGQDETNSKMAYQLILGAHMPMDALSLGVDYKYVNVGSAEYKLDNTTTIDHRINGGLSGHFIGAHVMYNL